MSQYVYHFKPAGMVGSSLIPLNQLRESFPEVYAEQAKKYQGRERIMEKKIPILNCLWNSVLHLSPIHPQIVMDTWRKEDLFEHTRIDREIEVYKIPTEMLEENKTVCFQSHNEDFNNFDPEKDKYWSFRRSEYHEQTFVQPLQIKIWQNDFAQNRRFLWYSHTMHVLAEQQIDISKCETVVCR